MKLGKRLKQIESMVTSDYTHICDCCCDHGLLGAALVSLHAVPHLHFVDVVPELMRELGKTATFYSNSSPTKTDDKPVKVSSVGELIWQTNTDEQTNVATNYLNKTLNHFQRMQRGGGPGVYIRSW